MREYIISEIRRLAELNGQPPGNQAFVAATGIIESKWRGKYWARWGDALTDAGFQRNSWAVRSDAENLLTGLILACRHYRHFPTNSEIAMLRNSDPTIPSPKVLRDNFDGREGIISALQKYIGSDPVFSDVIAMLPAIPIKRPAGHAGSKAVDGSVYLIKSGDFCKIGRSDELERRVKEIRIALPDAATLLHTIKTDDPPGIEAYWHRRFADRRANGEWFRLTSDDLKAFRRRNFQ